VDDEHDLALELAQVEVLAVDVFHGEVERAGGLRRRARRFGRGRLFAKRDGGYGKAERGDDEGQRYRHHFHSNCGHDYPTAAGSAPTRTGPSFSTCGAVL